jgi:hypothetical protein
MIIDEKCKKVMIALFALFYFSQVQAQDLRTIRNTTPVFAINSNLLYDATASMNLGIEFKLNKQLTLKLPVAYNPWTFDNNKQLRLILAQPELRWWLCESFSGHFLGLHGHYALYNVGSIGTDYMKKHRYEGYLYGGGISYGYQFYLAPRWSLEVSIGLGYAYMNYDVYKCETCGEYIKSENKNYFGPTKADLSLIYLLK